ncbi:MAG: hypothetical protein SXG53_14115, partial [Pseudomonadota bacterium]|nr:hypothetical protein [Pseudomonadota bacterium]
MAGEERSKRVGATIPLFNEGPIARTLLQFAFPILCMNVLQMLSGSVSAFWVGRYLGEAALTAVACCCSIRPAG